MSEMRYTAKDSLFTYLFKHPEYARQLYLVIHPEDQGVTADDCKIITLENVLTTGLYNDLGIQVRNRLILLVEAQSTFSINIALRMLLYLAETYKEYIKDHKLDLYASTPVMIPRPELYVIYTGGGRDVPDSLRLSDLYEGLGSAEVQVTILKGRTDGDIVDQYVQFCKVLDEQRKLYGYTKKTIEETIRICLDKGILAPFLVSRQKEVIDIMGMLFDQKTIMEIHDHNVAEHARQEGLQEGRKEGREEGHREGREQELLRMANLSKLLTEKGREDEFMGAIADRAVYDKLIKEFGL